ncbi:hypothetical protein [Marinivivus vitaminiproducens]|uniref:hypothetical protein n=1 Tax=Marinivivus vitaminiproducens TaxID=3035935 RepID=UPI0027A6FF86|nr:hypothetical protein P4R82_23725 [Geminicoccaceae bacterium SCSIO 64248]WGF90891.1 hypothetical protein P4R82_24085 [Geminicoccaceae bacterium SCSIO 64248]
MQDPRTKPSSPAQLMMPLDSTLLQGMSSLDRQQAVRRLAILLTEAAAGVVDAERRDDGR